MRSIRMRAIGLFLALGLVVAACGDDDDSSSGATSPSGQTTGTAGSGDPGDSDDEAPTDPDGVLRMAYDLEGVSRAGSRGILRRHPRRRATSGCTTGCTAG